VTDLKLCRAALLAQWDFVRGSRSDIRSTNACQRASPHHSDFDISASSGAPANARGVSRAAACLRLALALKISKPDPLAAVRSGSTFS
jgi:hypothetical protein